MILNLVPEIKAVNHLIKIRINYALHQNIGVDVFRVSPPRDINIYLMNYYEVIFHFTNAQN